MLVIMNKRLITLSLAFAFISSIAVVHAAFDAGSTNLDDNTLGQHQVEKLWAGFAKPDLAALDQFVAPGFQSLHEDGARDWPKERKLVAELKLTPYVLSDYQVTRNGDVLVVTYQCKVGETIAAARLAKESTPRLDVFVQSGSEWKLLSHVNVRRVSSSTAANPLMIAQSPE
jgi:hypothetical protein